MNSALIEQIHAAKAELEAADKAKAEAQAEHKFVTFWVGAERILEYFERDLGTNWRQAAIVTEDNGSMVLMVPLGSVIVYFRHYTDGPVRFWAIHTAEEKAVNFRCEGSELRERMLLAIGRVAGLEGGKEQRIRDAWAAVHEDLDGEGGFKSSTSGTEHNQ